MTKPGIAEKLESFVENGGTIVTTYMTGWVNETDLCHLGGFPGPLRKLCGIWSEEIDCLTPGETNPVAFLEGNHMSIAGVFDAHTYCEIIHPETAKVLACYTNDFYSGSPAMTVNKFGNGKVYYMATRFNDDLLDQIYEYLILKLKLRRSLNGILPYGVTANYRTDGNKDYIFVMNFTDKSQSIALSDNTVYNDMFTHSKIRDNVELNAYGLRILIKDCLQE
jgi:beta-galactosidase